jgi:nucleotide-binding universal stress UspA family protein
VNEMRMKRAAVIGVDGSAQALCAVRLAELALAPLLDWNVVERNEWARLDKELASCSARYPDVGFSSEVSRDRPAYRLSQLSRRAQRLVVGPRGRDEFSSLLLGSVSHALLRKADCPVAIVRLDRPGGS